jgi:hypothetical protein
MKDVKGFCKLMDISVPEYEHFDYYINQFSKLEKWKNIKDLIKIYEEAEEKYGDLYEFRLKKSNEIINYLKSTRAYNELQDDNLLPDLPTTKNFEYSEDKKYISIDIKKANWAALKKYDPEFAPELGDSYEDFIAKFDVPEIFNHSKQLRQYIFGNINPKRQGKAQRVITQSILNKYNHLNLDIACIKNYEVIYSFESFDQIEEILTSVDKEIFKIKLFTVKRVQDFRINTFLSESGEKLYKEMVGCNGNQFFMNLKNYIFEEPLDIRDLYFRMDGSLAIWNVDKLKISL